ncbi:MAG: putative sulfate exporter family transporter [Candidatus Omnitrophota bacterium]
MFKEQISKLIFWFVLIFCFTPWSSPPLALMLGLALAMTLGNPYKEHQARAVKYLLQASVVGLGFGMNFTEVVSAGKSGVGFTFFSIAGTLAAGYFIGRWLSVARKTSFLVSVGTAICGGSAIAAVAPLVEADEKEVAVSLGTIFILNAVALFVFPWLGHVLGMKDHQFGLWSAIAIHDTSSVVGAAAHYGTEALKTATTVKLTRALWIIPVALITAIVLKKKDARISFPYFILAFVGASLVVSLWPAYQPVYSGVVTIARIGLTVTLFLIGTGLSPTTLKTVGFRPVMQGVWLWLLVSGVSLGYILQRM